MQEDNKPILFPLDQERFGIVSARAIISSERDIENTETYCRNNKVKNSMAAKTNSELCLKPHAKANRTPE